MLQKILKLAGEQKVFKKLRIIIQRLPTKSLVMICWGVGFLSLFSMVFFPQDESSKFRILMVLTMTSFWFGLGGVVMILRKQTFFSGYDDNPFGIIYGGLMLLVSIGLFFASLLLFLS